MKTLSVVLTSVLIMTASRLPAELKRLGALPGQFAGDTKVSLPNRFPAEQPSLNAFNNAVPTE